MRCAAWRGAPFSRAVSFLRCFLRASLAGWSPPDAKAPHSFDASKCPSCRCCSRTCCNRSFRFCASACCGDTPRTRQRHITAMYAPTTSAGNSPASPARHATAYPTAARPAVSRFSVEADATRVSHEAGVCRSLEGQARDGLLTLRSTFVREGQLRARSACTACSVTRSPCAKASGKHLVLRELVARSLRSVHVGHLSLRVCAYRAAPCRMAQPFGAACT